MVGRARELSELAAAYDGGALTLRNKIINGDFSIWQLARRLSLTHTESTNAARDVTAKDGTGNLRLAGDFVLSHPEDRLVLEYNGTNWCEISRSDNTA